MHNTNQYKLIIKALKVFPILGALLLWIRVFWIFAFNYQNSIIELFVGTSIIGGILLILSSIVLEFCVLHKLFIYYNVFVGFCIDFQSIVGWGDFRRPMHIIVLIIGMLLFYQLLLKKCYK